MRSLEEIVFINNHIGPDGIIRTQHEKAARSRRVKRSLNRAAKSRGNSSR